MLHTGTGPDSKWGKFHYLRREVQKHLRSMMDEWWKKKAREIRGYAGLRNASYSTSA